MIPAGDVWQILVQIVGKRLRGVRLVNCCQEKKRRSSFKNLVIDKSRLYILDLLLKKLYHMIYTFNYMIFFHITFIKVCIDIKITIHDRLVRYNVQRSMTWIFGKCRGHGRYYETVGTAKRVLRFNELMHTYLERCCNLPGQHLLRCGIETGWEKDQGWAENFIEIQGQRYCHDFIGYSAIRPINLIGLIRKYLTYTFV